MVYFVGCKAIQSSCLHKSKFTQENGIELPETGLPESHKVLTTEPSPGLHVEPIPLIDDASEEDDSYSITCGPVSTQSADEVQPRQHSVEDIHVDDVMPHPASETETETETEETERNGL